MLPLDTITDSVQWLLIAVAFASSALSGLAGAGGGTILIGTIYAVGIPPVLAVPLHAAVQMVSNGSRVVAYLRHVRWRAAWMFCLGAIPAPFLVAPILAKIDPNLIRLVMAAFILWALLPRLRFGERLSERAAMATAGILNGGVGAVVGATGLLIGPFFLRPDWSKGNTIGSLALCQSIGHLAKVAAFAVAGFTVFQFPYLLIGMAVAVIGGTALGKWLNRRLPEAQFQNLFRAVLICLAIKLVWDVLRS